LSKRRTRSVPRESPYKREVRFTEQEFIALAAVASAGGVSKAQLVHGVITSWLKHVAKAMPSEDRPGRDAELPFCSHAAKSWVRYKGEPPWCPACARPTCPRCRRHFKLESLKVDGDGDGIGVFGSGCRCATGAGTP